MKRGRTALTWRMHIKRALDQLKIKPKVFWRGWDRYENGAEVARLAFGRGPNRRASVLLVPELRKRRSERDPVALAQQIKDAGNRLAEIRAGRVAA